MPELGPAAVVRAQLEAYNSHDVERMLSFYTEDAVILDRDGGVIDAGREAMRQGFTELFAGVPDLRAEYLAPIEVGEWVALICVVPNWRMPDGAVQEMKWLEVLHVAGGKIKELRLYH
jgi:uncharacterized protein (TIGR02246 family)